MKKRVFCGLLILALLLGIFASCGGTSDWGDIDLDDFGLEDGDDEEETTAFSVEDDDTTTKKSSKTTTKKSGKTTANGSDTTATPQGETTDSEDSQTTTKKPSGTTGEPSTPSSEPQSDSETTTKKPSVTTDEPTTDEPTTDEPTTDEPETPDPTDPVAEGKEIDIYFVIGQSNAVGYTKVKDAEAAYAVAPELRNGFTNVIFAGETRWDDDNSPTLVSSRNFEWQPTTLGLGAYGSTYFGPEAGMAKALSAYYNEETGNVAGIIKFGHGGTSLLSETRGSSTKGGSWSSPSYAAKMGYDYTGKTGKLYRDFLEVTKTKLQDLQDLGYTKINVKGLYWMHGYTDRDLPNEYDDAFQCFASDVRADLSALMIEVTGRDRGAAEVPILIGLISRTQNLTSAATENHVNVPFIEMQKALATKITNCYTVDNSVYAISYWDSTKNKTVTVGNDNWHWNQADVLTIGKNVGEQFFRCFGWTGLKSEDTGDAMVWDLSGGT